MSIQYIYAQIFNPNANGYRTPSIRCGVILMNHTAYSGLGRPVFVIYDNVSPKAFKGFPGKFRCQILASNKNFPA